MKSLIKRSDLLLPSLFGDDFNVFDDVFKLFRSNVDDAQVDIVEHDKDVEVIAEIPGFKKEDIEIKYEKGYLTISGEIKKDTEKKTAKYLHREIGSRSFARRFYLGDSFDSDKIDATFKDGILNVILFR